jgi:hypothetical protein
MIFSRSPAGDREHAARTSLVHEFMSPRARRNARGPKKAAIPTRRAEVPGATSHGDTKGVPSGLPGRHDPPDLLARAKLDYTKFHEVDPEEV